MGESRRSAELARLSVVYLLDEFYGGDVLRSPTPCGKNCGATAVDPANFTDDNSLGRA